MKTPRRIFSMAPFIDTPMGIWRMVRDDSGKLAWEHVGWTKYLDISEYYA